MSQFLYDDIKNDYAAVEAIAIFWVFSKNRQAKNCTVAPTLKSSSANAFNLNKD